MINDDAVNQYLTGLIYERALSKFSDNETIPLLSSRAANALKLAGRWTDDVTIAVKLNHPPLNPGKVHRIVHGLPSPRYWLSQDGSRCEMPATDVIYFFMETIKSRTNKYLEAMPEFQWVDDVETWMRTFTKRKFDDDLVRAVMRDITSTKPSAPNLPYAEVMRDAAIKRGACIAAEIDRYAWFRGYRSMNLVKAAPVFLPGMK